MMASFFHVCSSPKSAKSPPGMVSVRSAHTVGSIIRAYGADQAQLITARNMNAE